MEGLGLVTMGAGRARSRLIVVQVVIVMMKIIHGGRRSSPSGIDLYVVHTPGTFPDRPDFNDDRKR